MTYILTQSEAIRQLPKTEASMGYAQMLAIGQECEIALAKRITELGIPCRKLDQKFIPSDRLKKYKRHLNPKHLRPDRSLYRSHQVDLAIKLDGRLRLVELKALCGAGFRKRWIHIGLEAKYDQKVMPIAWVMLYNQDSGQVYVCPPKRCWGSDYAIYDKTYSQRDYTVERSRLVPLEDWIEELKAGRETCLYMPLAQQLN